MDDKKNKEKNNGQFLKDRYPHVHYHNLPDMQEFYHICGMLRDWCRALTFLGEQLAGIFGDKINDIIAEINTLTEKLQNIIDNITTALTNYFNALDAYIAINNASIEQNTKLAAILYNLIDAVGTQIVNILECIENRLIIHDEYISDIYSQIEYLRKALEDEIDRAKKAEEDLQKGLDDEKEAREDADEAEKEAREDADKAADAAISEAEGEIEDIYKLIQEIVSQNYEDISSQFSDSILTFQNNFTGTPHITAYRATVNTVTYDEEHKATKHKYITDTIQIQSSSTYPVTNSALFTSSNSPFVFAHSNYTTDSDIVIINFGAVNSHYRSSNCTSYEQVGNKVWNTTAYYDNDGSWETSEASRSDWGVSLGRHWSDTNECRLYAASIEDGYNSQYTVYIDKYFPTNNSTTISYVDGDGNSHSSRILNLRHIERLGFSTLNFTYKWVFTWEE